MAPTAASRSSDPLGAYAPTSDPSSHEWLSLEHDGDTYLFDITFLTSNWTCIFGAGCKGVHEQDTTDLVEGCCSHGAHFADAADRRRVQKMARRLGDDQWQNRALAAELGGPTERGEGREHVTRTVDGACIFLNRPGFARGPGCALHVGAMDAGESYVGWKPEVCWQLPLRLTHHTDELDHTTWTLREWKRRDWGEGGDDFHWWCTDAPDAFVGSSRVVDSMEDEIVGLVGREVHRRLLAELDSRPAETWLPHPAVRNRPPERS